MLKLAELENGKVKNEEVFENFQGLKKHLMENDYFSWVLDNEPERELPDFSNCETVEDIERDLQEFDYSWWSLEILEEDEFHI